MKAYNLYNNGVKINSKPLFEDDIKNILSEDFIFKKIDEHTSEKIYVKNLKIIKCTVL